MRTYRASSLGYSLEALVAGHLGYAPVDPPEWLQEKFDEGIALEPQVIEELGRRGWVLTSSQSSTNAVGDNQIEVELHVIPDIATVVGHLDAYGTCGHEPPHRVIEIKSMADKYYHEVVKKGWDTPGILQRYKWQLSCYMLATSAPAVMVCCSKKLNAGELELTYLYADEPFYTISDIANKLQLAEDAIAAGVVPDGCEDFPCPYYYLHPPKDEVEKADGELERLLSEWLLCDGMEKQYKGLKDAKRVQILALAGDNLAAKVKGECGVTVETYWQNESEYTVKKKEGWVSRISGPRKGKGEDRG